MTVKTVREHYADFLGHLGRVPDKTVAPQLRAAYAAGFATGVLSVWDDLVAKELSGGASVAQLNRWLKECRALCGQVHAVREL